MKLAQLNRTAGSTNQSVLSARQAAKVKSVTSVPSMKFVMMSTLFGPAPETCCSKIPFQSKTVKPAPSVLLVVVTIRLWSGCMG